MSHPELEGLRQQLADATAGADDTRPDLGELRSRVMSAVAQGTDDRVDLAGRSGLMMAFDDLAPAALRLGARLGHSLVVQLGERQPTSRDVTDVVDHMQRAVVAIAKEIRAPQEEYARLASADYEKVPLFVTAGPGNHITLRASAGDLVFQKLETQSLAQQALSRLANLLPSDADDTSAIDAALGGREPTRRALHEVALASKRAKGITVTLRDGGDDEVTGVVSQDQGQELEEQLTQAVTETEPLRLVGKLDGARSKRRLFYFEVQGQPEIHGVIDENLVTDVFDNLRHKVEVSLERTRTRTLAGTRGHWRYRLVGLRPVPEETD